MNALYESWLSFVPEAHIRETWRCREQKSSTTTSDFIAFLAGRYVNLPHDWNELRGSLSLSSSYLSTGWNISKEFLLSLVTSRTRVGSWRLWTRKAAFGAPVKQVLQTPWADEEKVATLSFFFSWAQGQSGNYWGKSNSLLMKTELYNHFSLAEHTQCFAGFEKYNSQPLIIPQVGSSIKFSCSLVNEKNKGLTLCGRMRNALNVVLLLVQIWHLCPCTDTVHLESLF